MKPQILILSALFTFLSIARGAEIGIHRVEPRSTPELREMKFVVGAQTETLYVEAHPVIGTRDFIAGRKANGKLILTFTREAQVRFKELTKERSGGQRFGRLAILVDGVIVSAPNVRSEIQTESITVEGALSQEQIDGVLHTIENGGKKG